MLRLNTIVRSYRAGDNVVFSMPERNGLVPRALRRAAFVHRDGYRPRDHAACRSSAAAAACSTRSTAQSRATQCPSCRRAVMPCLPISTSLRCARCAPRPRLVEQFLQQHCRHAMYRRCSITLSIISSTRCAAASRASCLKKPMHTPRTASRASRTRRSRTTSARRREVISRELEGMRQMGLLQTGRGKIYVLDRAALEGMANL